MPSRTPERCHPNSFPASNWIVCLTFLSCALGSPQPANTQETAPTGLDLSKNGQYASGAWTYTYSITNAGSRSEGYHGNLSYDKTALPRPVQINDFYETPWGRLYWVGHPGVLFGGHGWMSKPLARAPIGQVMIDPAIVSHERFAIRVKVLTLEELATPDSLEQDPAVLGVLKPFGPTQAHVQENWFQLEKKLTTLHDTKRWGTLTVRRANPTQSQPPTLEFTSRGSLTIDTSPGPTALEDIGAMLELSTLLEDLSDTPKTISLSPQIETLQPLKCTLSSSIGSDLILYLVCQIQDLEKPSTQSLCLGPEMHGKTVTVTSHKRVVIELPGNATTGYAWTFVSIQGNAVKHIPPIDYSPTPQTETRVGAGGLFKASFEVVNPGTAKIRLGYQRPWDTSKSPAKTFDVTLVVTNNANQPTPPTKR